MAVPRILIIGQDPAGRERWRKVLGQGELQPPLAEAASAEEALGWLRKNTADLIVMEPGTAEAVGGDLLRALGRQEARVDESARERHQAEQRLQQSEGRFRALITQSPFGIFETDAAGDCTFVNAAWTAIAGLDFERALGRGWTSALHPDDAATFLAEWHGSIAAQREFALEFRFLREGGEIAWVSGRARALLDAEGKVAGYLGSVVDVTERRSQQAALVAAKEAAEQASRAKADFLAKMSHEIRTPMNSVIGMTELLLESQLDSDQRSYAELAVTAAKGLLHLLNDLLDFSRIEAGRLRIEHIEFSLREHVARVVRSLMPRARDKRLEMSVDFAPGLPDRLLGDPHRLAQVVTNLLVNALKFTHSGSITLSFDELCRDGRRMLHACVSDTGIGVLPAKHALILQAFGQADEGVSRKFGGTGLGLAICAQLVKLMNGELWFESELSRGSRFHFTVDLEQAAPNTIEDGQFPTRELEVLVVVPQPALRRSLVELIYGWRMEPAVAVDGPEAAQLLGHRRERRPFSAVVLDAQLLASDQAQLLAELTHGHAQAGVILLADVGARLPSAARDALSRLRLSRLSPPLVPSELFEALQAVTLTKSQLPPPESHAGARSLRVLVVEDNEMNQTVARAVLRASGHEVVLVGDAESGITAALEPGRFDVVLMDVEMPGMSGLEATREIRVREAAMGGHIPIVALTAQALSGDAARCLAAGMDAYLAKPLELAELDRVLREVTAVSPIGAAWTGRPPAASDHDAGVLDRQALTRLIGTSPDTWRELLGIYERDVPRLLDELSGALAAEDRQRARRAAHAIKSIALNLCASEASRQAREVEQLATEGSLAAASAQLGQLQSALSNVDQVLRRMLETERPGTAL